MPPCVSDMPSYQTLYLTNHAETSMTFNFDLDSKDHFQVYPQSAMVMPKSTQVCFVRFLSTDLENPKNAFNLQCHVNQNPKYLKVFNLSAFVDSPLLLIDKNVSLIKTNYSQNKTLLLVLKINFAFPIQSCAKKLLSCIGGGGGVSSKVFRSLATDFISNVMNSLFAFE